MSRYQFRGPAPVERDGELFHPLDIREFDGPPDWGPWEPLGEPEQAPAAKTPEHSGPVSVALPAAVVGLKVSPPADPKGT